MCELRLAQHRRRALDHDFARIRGADPLQDIGGRVHDGVIHLLRVRQVALDRVRHGIERLGYRVPAEWGWRAHLVFDPPQIDAHQVHARRHHGVLDAPVPKAITTRGVLGRSPPDGLANHVILERRGVAIET